MTRKQKILEEIEELKQELIVIQKTEFANRPLPDFWKEGQHVRLLVDKEWFADKGTIVKIVKVMEPDLPANKRQTLYTDYIKANWSGTYYTTSDEVELYV